MQKEPMIYRELILLDPTFDTQHGLFESLFHRLKALGFVRDSFLNAIEDRERRYPTALPTEPFPIAIPHTDPEHIVKPFIAVIRLNRGVLWKQMVSEEDIAVKVVFLLGFEHHSEYHVRLLQKLMDLFSGAEFPRRLMEAETIEQCYQLSSAEIGNLEA